MQSSESIAKLAEALAKAQAEMTAASCDGKNPHFSSKYATLASVMEALKPANAHGLAIVQSASVDRTNGVVVNVHTILTHASGEWISDALALRPGADTPQAIGSAITYGRRYMAAAFTGVAADEDDDGNAATKPQAGKPQTAAKPQGQKPNTPPANPPQGTKPTTPAAATTPEKTEAPKVPPTAPAEKPATPPAETKPATPAASASTTDASAEKVDSAKPAAVQKFYVCRSCSSIEASFEDVKKCRHCPAGGPLVTYRSLEKAKEWKKDFPAAAAGSADAEKTPETKPADAGSSPAATEPTSQPASVAAKQAAQELAEINNLFIKLGVTDANERMAGVLNLTGTKYSDSRKITTADRAVVLRSLREQVAAMNAENEAGSSEVAA